MLRRRLPITLSFLLFLAALACQDKTAQSVAAQATKPPLGQGSHTGRCEHVAAAGVFGRERPLVFVHWRYRH